jgi:hypothetical protein
MVSMAIGLCEYRQMKYYIDETNCTHFYGRYGRLQFGDVLHMPWISSKNALV